MQLRFLGANHQVTGSSYLLSVGTKRILIDCGMYQERAFLSRNWDPFPVDSESVEVMLLTHAHLDHCGLIPKFVREGFRGKILSTAPSIDLARLVLEDSARIQVEDAEYKKRRHEREGRRGPHPEIPLYMPEDVDDAVRQFQIVSYDKWIHLGDGVEVCFRDAGHILGSAVLEIRIDRGGDKKTLVFSGDIGPSGRPLMHDPARVGKADYVVMESTYGDRDHENEEETIDTLARVVNETIERHGNLIVPTFAIDRAQQLLYYFGELARGERIPPVTVFIDSPMAISATTIYKRYPHLLDEMAKRLVDAGQHPFQFPGLHFVRTADESRSINTKKGTSIILAGSGMCTGGRVKHHLRQNIERPESTVLFAGFQAEGTLGRHISQGDPEVRIHGRQYTVRARIEKLEGLSAHADRTGLLQWLGGFEAPPTRLFLTHGEDSASKSLAQAVKSKLGWDVQIPEYGDVHDLSGDSATADASV